MQTNNKKDLLSPATGFLLLLGIILTAVCAHLLFVAKDARPCIHPAWFYFNFGYLKVHTFLYDAVLNILKTFTPNFDYNYYMVYRYVNILYLLPLITFFYLSVSTLFNRSTALLASLFLITAPEVINIFHLTGINFQTMTLFSLLIYCYIKTNYFQNRLFCLLFTFCLYIFSLNHHSFLIYMATCIPLWLILVLRTEVRKKLDLKNIIYASLLLTGLLLVYNEISFTHITKYFSRQDCFEKITTFEFTMGSISGTCIYFLNEIKINLQKLINNEFKHFDLYFIASVAAIIIHLVGNAAKLIRKTKLSAANIIELQSIFFVFCFLFLLSLESQIPTEMYLTPLYLFIALLNCLAIIKTYTYLKYNFKHLHADKTFITGFILIFSLYSFFLLFMPGVLISDSSNTNRSYNYSNEDYNLSKHIKFFSQNNISIKSIAVTAKQDNAATPNAYLFNLWFGLRGDIKETLPEQNNFITISDTNTAYIVFFYDLEKNKELILEETHAMIIDFIRSQYNIKDNHQIDLLEILAYGFKAQTLVQINLGNFTNTVETDRRYLTFIFAIKDSKGLKIKRFT